MARPKKERTFKTLFSKRINILFAERNIFEFEQKYGLSSGQISRFLDGVEPKMSSLEAIIKGTGCRADWLLFGEGEPMQGDEMNSDVLGSRAPTRMHQFFQQIMATPDWEAKYVQIGVNINRVKSFRTNTVPDRDDLVAFARMDGNMLWLLTGEGEMERKTTKETNK